MRLLPGEAAKSAEIQKRLAPEFEFAGRVFSFWMGRPKDPWLARCQFNFRGLNVAMMLSIQACRQLRTVVDLCKRGEAHDASVIGRSLFETTMALFFVLKPKVYIALHSGKHPGEFHAALPPKGSYRKRDLTEPELRANLYLAHSALQDVNFVARSAKKWGRKTFAKRMGAVIDPSFIATVDASIGPKWSYVLRHRPFTFSGLTVADLARALGHRLPLWYDTVYHFQSGMAHAADAIRNVEETRAGGSLQACWLSSTAEVAGAMETALTMFLACISLLHEHLYFGVGTGMALEQLRTEYQSLRFGR